MAEELVVRSEQVDVLVSQTNGVLKQNQSSVEKAKHAGFALLDEIEQNGMNEEVDSKANDILVKLRKTHQAMLERRKPITQMFDQVKKVFTSLENELDAKRGDSIYAQIQCCRDAYAAEKAADAERKRKEAERKIAIENERVDVRAKVTVALTSYFETYLFSQINKITAAFHGLTLDGVPEFEKKIQSVSTEYLRQHFDAFTVDIPVVNIDKADVREIIRDVRTDEVYNKFSDDFFDKIDGLKNSITEMLPGKKEELEAICEAEKKDKEEAERLRQESESRRLEEQQRLAAEAIERKKAAELAAEQNKKSAQMQNLFDATVVDTPAPTQARKGYEITVTHQKGWIEIFNFWFLKEGVDLPVDAIGRKSLDQMKTFCQNAAKEGGKITSSYLKYKETYKAIAKS